MPAPLRNPPLFTLTIFLTILFSPCSAIDAQSQARALLAWKERLNSSTDALGSWNSADKSPCKWFGITCNSNGDVVKIILKSVELQGPLPSNLQALESLETLIISSANVTGSIPREFGDYIELVLLDVSDNSITGTIPEELCWLKKLQTLSLDTNYLEGEIPQAIGNLSSLKHLTLYDNQISGEIPRSFTELKNLEVFRAGGNENLRGELPPEIGNCENLQVLGLAETAISGSLPSSIGKLRSIQTIAIYTALLSGPIPEEIGNCSELQNLYLYQNSISGSIPRSIGRLRKLQSLMLWQNSLVGTIPFELGSCSELKVVDLSENLLSGSIPTSFGGLSRLEDLQLSVNRLSGTIPDEISNCTALIHFEVDNNEISGEIPVAIGGLKSLTIFFAWENNLTGNIPESLSQCENLQALDLSYNNLFGQIPKGIFSIRNLTKVLLLSNDLSGFIPPDIGNCTELYRFRVNDNRIGGTIPVEIGNLKVLNFVDMSNNNIMGAIPQSLSGCLNLEYLDLHSNALSGPVPDSLPKNLQYVDVSDNRLSGSLGPSIGSLIELTKLSLGRNQISGKFPAEIVSCTKLQMLDIGSNGFSGEIPKELGQIPSLAISLNLSRNEFTGDIPAEFSGLTKLGNLDLSHNNLTGKLDILAQLQNLVSLNLSFNNFVGELPNSPFFHDLPSSDLTGNPKLYVNNGVVTPEDSSGHAKSALKLAMPILVTASAVLVLLTVYILVRSHIANKGSSSSGFTEKWEMTLYQKMDLSIDDIVRNLTSANVIGTGSSGVVYRVTIPNEETLAVKKMWSGEESGAFSSEIRTLGSIRHKNIVRLLGWGSNQSLKLLFYDYLPNGSLSSLLHGTGKGGAEWETRYEIVVGVAHALAYLHHDCVPPILHGDVKAMNVLLGPRMEPYLADFGLARTLHNNSDADTSLQAQHRPPHLKGSYGYMAPEHGSMRHITEKSDVYSFGVVLLEVLTGRHPLDPTLPGGAHLVQWVREHLHNKRDPIEVLDVKLRGRADPQMHEMLQTLAVSFLCVSAKAEGRPTMKDVVAMLKEIHHEEPEVVKGGRENTVTKSPRNSNNNVSQVSASCSFEFSDSSITH